MGNWQGWGKHGFTETMVAGKEGTVLEALRQAGLSSVESFLDRLVRETTEYQETERDPDILQQVKRMLDEQEGDAI